MSSVQGSHIALKKGFVLEVKIEPWTHDLFHCVCTICFEFSSLWGMVCYGTFASYNRVCKQCPFAGWVSKITFRPGLKYSHCFCALDQRGILFANLLQCWNIQQTNVALENSVGKRSGSLFLVPFGIFQGNLLLVNVQVVLTWSWWSHGKSCHRPKIIVHGAFGI